MQWYVYLVTIAAIAFLSKIVIELVIRPLRAAFCLRREALARMLSCRNISLPRPRELAVTSLEIHEYDQAVRNVRNAQRGFADIGARFLALGESEPTIRTLMASFGFDIVSAGHELINLSQVYAASRSASEFHHDVEEALDTINAALAISRRNSRNEITRIRLEPICLRDAASARRRNEHAVRPRTPPYLAHRHSQRRQRPSREDRLSGFSQPGWS
jgi:hypothetical protein